MDDTALRHVLEVSRKMAEIHTITPLLDYVVTEAIALTAAQRGVLVLAEPGGSFEFHAGKDSSGKPIENPSDEVSLSVVEKVIGEGQPMIVRDAVKDPRLVKSSSVRLHKLRSIMAVPLMSRGETLGALYVEHRKGSGLFEDDHLAPLTIFGNQAAVAIENARLIEGLETRVVMKTSELRRALHQVEERWQAERDDNENRTLTLGAIAHDIRAPLTLAFTAMAMLEDSSFGDMTPEQQEWARKGRDATRFALDMLEDVFDLSRMELGALELAKEATSLGDFLAEVADSAELFSFAKDVRFQVDLPDQLPTVLIDVARIRRVVFNLLTNALKFTNEGTITLYARDLPDEGIALIGVRDTGEGVAPEDTERIFARFEQADDQPRRRAKGSGLGLAISREMVTLHGGKIWVESVPGEGSDFKFTLPVDQNSK